ncbi:MAG: InlB B-repeat-containing protein [Acholeplasmatales bacterium]|nr:InlB B-repeat-containing protein [Acholeplasmatales bacterium]MBR6288540.1 InlB B-repeat-containing protein [Acholeplasmatales bacterium]
MKIRKLFLGLLLASAFTLASCDLLSEDATGSNNTKTTDTGDSGSSTTTKYTVKFETNGGSSVSSQKIESGSTATKPTDPTKKGYSFVGWFSDDALTTEFDFSAVISSSTTIYAKWAIESYTVSFNVKGGNETIDDQTVEYNGTLTKPTDPTKDGYTFGGWYTSTSYLTEFAFTSKVTRSFTLYAKWNEIPKVAKYELGEATVDTWTDSIGSKWMKIAVPITNTGTVDLYLDDISVDIETQSGTLLQTKSMISGYPEYIKPGETGYYYTATSRDFTETNVKVVPHVNAEKATNSVLRYKITDVTITADQYYGVKVMGRVENTTSKKGSMDKIAACLFDANGKLICVAFTYLDDDLAVGAKVGFSMTPFAFRNFTPEDVASYEVYGYPTQFNW